ncbi:hypothetical protein [Pyrodictium abyssi]|uniref:Uncharacterized protein n=1 Tax=Pyrodictium abyssi TaxID=54256 RepID=A0ABM8IVF8_9CREN|nr:hypothetical protein PABY_11120 [Pyrodictium abyssi]
MGRAVLTLLVLLAALLAAGAHAQSSVYVGGTGSVVIDAGFSRPVEGAVVQLQLSAALYVSPVSVASVEGVRVYLVLEGGRLLDVTGNVSVSVEQVNFTTQRVDIASEAAIVIRQEAVTGLRVELTLRGVGKGQAVVAYTYTVAGAVSLMESMPAMPFLPITGSGRTVVEVADTVTLQVRLAAGWNLVGVSVEPLDPRVEAVFEGTPVSAVYYYNASAGKWMYWVPGSGGTLRELHAGMGLWVYAGEPFTLTITGTPAVEPGPGLAPGWNLVAPLLGTGSQPYPGDPVYPAEYCAKYGCTAIYYYDPEENRWLFWAPGNPASTLLALQPGKAYYVYRPW